MMEEEDCDRLRELFDKCRDESHNFENIPEAERRHPWEDLCAMIYLHEKLGGNGSAISAAEHDQIWLSFDDLHKLTEEDILYVTRCGVFYDDDVDSLSMFV